MCCVAALVLLCLAAPLLVRFIGLLRSIEPEYGQPDAAAIRDVHRRAGGDARIVAVHSAFRALDEDRLPGTLDQLHRADPKNGLYTYLELLARLRRPATTAPSEEGDILGLLARSRHAPPASLHQDLYRRVAEETLRAHRLSPLRIPLDSLQMAEAQPPQHRQVLRELGDRLLPLAATWRTAGRADDAAAAELALVRLFESLLRDTPTPSVALLAAEALPEALRGLGRDGHIEADRAEAAANAAARFRRDWHARAGDEVSIIPWTGDFTLVPEPHRRLMTSTTAALLVSGTWVVMALLILVLLPLSIRNPEGPTRLRARFRGWGAWIGAVITLGPLLLLTVALFARPPAYTWLYSLPSLGVFLFLPVLPFASVGLASRFCFQTASSGPEGGQRPRSEALPDWRPSRRLAAVLSVLVLVVLAAGLALVRVHPEPWRPSPEVQQLRRIGLLTELACGLAAAVWIVIGQIRRRRAGVPVGVNAGANLAVASRALLVCSLLLWAALLLNSVRADQYVPAFTQAMDNPLAARLGQDWHQRYFGPTGQIAG